MDFRRAENELFDEWEKGVPPGAFSRDGVVDEVGFNSRNPRIVLVLKEVDSDGGFDLREFLYVGANNSVGGKTWAPVERWVRLLDADSGRPSAGRDRASVLRTIASMNLKKTPGGTVSQNWVIRDWALRNAEFLRRQIALYLDRPTVFVCCGVGVSFETFAEVAKGVPDTSRFKFNDRDCLRIGQNGVAFGTTHPNRSRIAVQDPYFSKMVRGLAELCFESRVV